MAHNQKFETVNVEKILPLSVLCICWMSNNIYGVGVEFE